jgi:preprotein translocase subunit SecG
MQIWMTLVLALQLLAALAMIGLVLIQHGKGADMGASFGSGASGSLFGATGSANFLSRSTAACATVFFVCTLALAFVGNASVRARQGRHSVLDRAGSQRRRQAHCGAIPGAIRVRYRRHSASPWSQRRPATRPRRVLRAAIPARAGGSAPDDASNFG